MDQMELLYVNLCSKLLLLHLHRAHPPRRYGMRVSPLREFYNSGITIYIWGIRIWLKPLSDIDVSLLNMLTLYRFCIAITVPWWLLGAWWLKTGLCSPNDLFRYIYCPSKRDIFHRSGKRLRTDFISITCEFSVNFEITVHHSGSKCYITYVYLPHIKAGRANVWYPYEYIRRNPQKSNHISIYIRKLREARVLRASCSRDIKFRHTRSCAVNCECNAISYYIILHIPLAWFFLWFVKKHIINTHFA